MGGKMRDGPRFYTPDSEPLFQFLEIWDYLKKYAVVRAFTPLTRNHYFSYLKYLTIWHQNSRESEGACDFLKFFENKNVTFLKVTFYNLILIFESLKWILIIKYNLKVSLLSHQHYYLLKTHGHRIYSLKFNCKKRE